MSKHVKNGVGQHITTFITTPTVMRISLRLPIHFQVHSKPEITLKCLIMNPFLQNSFAVCCSRICGSLSNLN